MRLYLDRKISNQRFSTNLIFIYLSQVFSRAKIYFSNEEGKFGDDRAVDFLYMPDTAIEDARNVSINLHGEHGRSDIHKYSNKQIHKSTIKQIMKQPSFTLSATDS